MPLNYKNLALSNEEKIRYVIGLILLGLLVGYGFYDSLWIGLGISILGFPLAPVYKKMLIGKHQGELLIQFKDMLYSISAGLITGTSMSQALEESIYFWQNTYDDKDYIILELKYMIGRIKGSNEVDVDVLKDFADRSGLRDIQDFVGVYENSKKTGANLSKAIENATSLIGDKISIEREIKVLMAQKIFEGRIVGMAPFIVIMALKLLSPSYMEPMYLTHTGKIIMTFALGLMGIAIYMIERINRIEV